MVQEGRTQLAGQAPLQLCLAVATVGAGCPPGQHTVRRQAGAGRPVCTILVGWRQAVKLG